MARRNELIKIMESELPDRNAIRKGYRPSRRQARYYYSSRNNQFNINLGYTNYGIIAKVVDF